MIATQNARDGVLPIAFDNEGYTSLYSTAGDLARFGMFHLKSYRPSQGQILSDSSIDLMWKYEDPEVQYSTRRIGWDVQQDFGFETVQHGGGGPGIHNWLYMIPSENIVIAILSNARYSSPKQRPVLIELIAAALPESSMERFHPEEGRGWLFPPRIFAEELEGDWSGRIAGPKGTCAVSVSFDSDGFPKMLIEGDTCSRGQWATPTNEIGKSYGSFLWRFDACIPYLHPYAIHDEVILTLWPQGDSLIGHAAAAKEKDFGHGENYVLPQYIELTRSDSR
jgi:hypothetical protein